MRRPRNDSPAWWTLVRVWGTKVAAQAWHRPHRERRVLVAAAELELSQRTAPAGVVVPTGIPGEYRVESTGAVVQLRDDEVWR